MASDAPSTQLNLNPFTACLDNEFRFLKVVDLQSACFYAETLQGPTRPMLPFLTRIHPDPKQPCFPICSIAGLRSLNAGTENETTQAEQLDKMLGVFRLS